ncbi:MAG TPA: MarR family transcriptional regulator [Candidatus Saccharimonadales bacterium]|nr:MarR family transcriptional regulator [Candidatus Saccharimonadales bacterium]
MNEETLLPILIKRSARLLDREIDALLKSHGIARSQYRVLYYVAERGELTQTELAGLLEVEAATLTRLVDALVKKGWLVRLRDEQDQRLKRIRLTAEGKRKFKNIPPPAEALYKAIQTQLDPKSIEALRDSLLTIIKQFT